MSGNSEKEKFSLDDILNEFSSKSGSDEPVDKIISQVENGTLSDSTAKSEPEKTESPDHGFKLDLSQNDDYADFKKELSESGVLPSETQEINAVWEEAPNGFSEAVFDDSSIEKAPENGSASEFEPAEEIPVGRSEYLNEASMENERRYFGSDGKSDEEYAEEFAEKYEEDYDEEYGEDFSYDFREKKKPHRGDPFKLDTSEVGAQAKVPTAQDEYLSPEDAPEIARQISKLKSGLFVRAAVLLFAMLFSVFITAANDLSLPLAAAFDRTVNPSAYIFTNTILAIVAVGFSYSVVFQGFASLFKRRPDSDSAAALGILAAIVSGVAVLFKPDAFKGGYMHVYTAAAITSLFFNALGKLSVVRRCERNFDFLSKSRSVSAITLVDDDSDAAYITNGSAGKRKELAVMKKTNFIKDFMKNSYSSDLSDFYAAKAMPIVFVVSLIIGAAAALFEKDASGAEKALVFLTAFSGGISLSSSFALTLIVNLPLSKAGKSTLDETGVILGYSSAEEFCEVNCVAVDANDIFPTGTVEFANLKMLSRAPIDKGIVYAASLAHISKSVTRSAFYKMLRGDLDMLADVAGCTVEENLGISGWIDSKRVILGSRELLERHGVEGLPTKTEQELFADGNSILYLSVAQTAVMMFAVSLSPRVSERLMKDFEDEGIEVHIRCSDGFITRELLSRLFRVSPNSVRLVPSNSDSDFERLTKPVGAVSSSMFCTGRLSGFAKTLVAAKRIKACAGIGVAVSYSAMFLSFVICLIMAFTGSFEQITPTLAIVYNLVFLIVTRIMQSAKSV